MKRELEKSETIGYGELGRPAEEVVTDFLKKVARVVFDEIASHLGRHVPSQIPADVIATQSPVSCCGVLRQGLQLDIANE
jgi:hypothetical protein